MPPSTTEPSDVPALGNAYNHARKAYGLTSALLMAWELIGVELEASPIESLKIKLKSPQAAPYVLVVLIIYFGFRMTIEWYQTDTRRRKLLASKVDFTAAHIIALASLALYTYQTLSEIQLADIITSQQLLLFVSGMLVALLLGEYTKVRRRYSGDRNVFRRIATGVGFLVCGSWITFRVIEASWPVRRGALWAALGGIAAGVMLLLLFRWLDWRARRRNYD